MDQDPFSRTQPIPVHGRRPPRRLDLGRKPLYLLAGAIALVGVLVSWWWSDQRKPPPQHPEAAAFQAVQEPRLDLIDGFRSYDDEYAVRVPLEAAGLHVERRVLRRPPSERYPPRELITLVIGGYHHLGVDGQLTMEFFNDRLMEIDFRPDDAASYARKLHQALPGLKRNRVGHAEWAQGNLRVWSNVDLAKSRVGGSLRTDALVLWQDLRLIRQRDDWDARFGGIPAPLER